MILLKLAYVIVLQLVSFDCILHHRKPLAWFLLPRRYAMLNSHGCAAYEQSRQVAPTWLMALSIFRWYYNDRSTSFWQGV